MLRSWVATAAVLSLLAAAAHVAIGPNNDQMLLLEHTRRLLGGAEPYVDYADLNPPMVHLLYAAPVAWASATGLAASRALHGFAVGLVAASLAATDLVLRRGGAPATTRAVALPALALALLGVSFVHQPFGDRDHLVLVLAAPWLALRSPLARPAEVPGWLQAAVGGVAAAGILIKPYFAVFYAAVVGWQLVAERAPLRSLARSPDHLAGWAVGAGYAALLFVAFPAWATAVLPLALASYDQYQVTRADKLAMLLRELGPFALPGLAGAWVLARAGATDRVVGYLLALLAAAAVDFVANSGWPYTLFPALALSFLVLVAVVARLARTGHRRVAALLALGGLAVPGVPATQRAVADVLSTRATGHPMNVLRLDAPVRARLAGHLADRPRFLLLSTTLWGVNLLEDGTPREDVGRFDALWPLPAIADLGADPSAADRRARLVAALAGGVAGDLERHAPDLVINDVSPVQHHLPPSFDALTVLRDDPSFRAAWGRYALVDRFDLCTEGHAWGCAYEVYARSSP